MASTLHDEEINQLIYENTTNLIEDSGLLKLLIHLPKATNLHLWKLSRSWQSYGNTTTNTIYQALGPSGRPLARVYTVCAVCAHRRKSLMKPGAVRVGLQS